METFKNYDRIIFLENGKITRLITSDENASEKKLSKTESDEYTIDYLIKNIVNNSKFRDLIIFILSEPVEIAVLKQLTASKDSGSNTSVMVLALGLSKDKYLELREMGISDIITEEKNIKEFLNTLTPVTK